MRVSAVPPPAVSFSGGAPEAIRFEPAPAWAETVPFDRGAKAGSGEPFTYLVFSEQQHVATHQAHVRMVIRLETMQAVQHLSQWRQRFDPVTETLALHALNVHRGESLVDHARPEKVRILQREEGLEAFILEGRHSALVLLEDVRPGDILEISYTLTTRPRLLPDFQAAFFSLPPAVTVCRHLLSVRFPAGSGMLWKSSGEMGAPIETLSGNDVGWSWSGDRSEGESTEAAVPPWHLPPKWVQISNLPDWRTVAGAVDRAWSREVDTAAVEKEARKIESSTSNLRERAELALRFVQDQFRYLSVNIELGGHVPAAPGDVISRR